MELTLECYRDLYIIKVNNKIVGEYIYLEQAIQIFQDLKNKIEREKRDKDN